MSFGQFFSRIPFFTFFLLASASSSSSMDAPTKNGYKPLGSFHGISTPTDFSQTVSGRKQQESKTPAYTEYSDPQKIAQRKEVFESAPMRAKRIVNHLKNKNYLDNGAYRVAIFWGEPGTGKTMTALAIADEMCKSWGWKCRFIPSGYIAEEHRNATAKVIRKIIDEINAENVPTILIFDEMNELLENTESKNHDTSVTSKLLWAFLTGQEGNPNFFCIGTMNRVDKLANPFKDRYAESSIQFNAITDTQLRNTILRKKLTSEFTQMDGNINEQQLNDLLQAIPTCTGRRLARIAGLCRETFRDEDDEAEKMVVNANHIRRALAISLQVREDFKYNRKEETDEERQERYHVVQVAQFEASQTTQRELSRAQLEQNQDQFTAQQTLQASLAEVNFGLQATIAARNAQNTSNNPYHSNWYINSLYGYYYTIFPERRPANYHRFPESRDEELQNKGKEETCVLQ